MWRRSATHLLEPIDPASVALFRICFGLLISYETLRHFFGGLLIRNYFRAEYQMHYYGFEWVTISDPIMMRMLFAACSVVALMVAVGFLYRLMAPLLFLGVTYWFLLDQTRHLNHMYLVCLVAFLFCLVPAHRAWSIDSLVFRTRYNRLLPRWGLWIFRFQMGCVYFYGGVAKINRDWLLHGQPLGAWMDRRLGDPLLGPFLQWQHASLFMSWSGFLIDILAVPFLLWKRTRIPMLVVLILFHVLNKYMFNIGIFPAMSIAATLLFLSPSWPRKVFRLPPFSRPFDASDKPLLRPATFVAPMLLVPYVLIQILLPLRSHLYPSYVLWSEEGHRYSWRMMMRTKKAEGYFIVQSYDQGHIEIIRPEDTLAEHQIASAMIWPDMIIQVAHRLAAQEEARLGEPVQVFAHVTCRLNHHEPQLLVDPAVDLARVPRNLLPADWIMPFVYSPIGKGDVPVDEDPPTSSPPE